MNLDDIEVVLFDVGGVLRFSSVASGRSFRAAFESVRASSEPLAANTPELSELESNQEDEFNQTVW